MVGRVPAIERGVIGPGAQQHPVEPFQPEPIRNMPCVADIHVREPQSQRLKIRYTRVMHIFLHPRRSQENRRQRRTLVYHSHAPTASKRTSAHIQIKSLQPIKHVHCSLLCIHAALYAHAYCVLQFYTVCTLHAFHSASNYIHRRRCPVPCPQTHRLFYRCPTLF